MNSIQLCFVLFIFQSIVFPNLDDAIDLFLESEIAIIQGNTDIALLYLHKAKNIYPDSPTIYKSIAEIHQNNNDLFNALENFLKAYELNKNDKKLQFKLIEIYKVMGRMDEAIKFLDELLLVNSQDVDFLYEKAQIYFIDENWESLIQIYAKIYEIDREILILERMIELGNATGNINNLYKHIQNIQINESDEVIILEILAKISYSLENFNSAISYLERLNEITQSPIYYFLLGEIYMKLDNYSDAKINFENSHKLDSNNLDTMRFLLICYSTLSEKQNEKFLSKLIMKNFPEESLGFESYAVALLNDGQISEAISVLIQAKNRFPDNFSIMFYLASSYKQIFQYEESLEEFKLALKYQPQSSIVWHSMALIYEDMNQYNVSDSLFKLILDSDLHNAMDKNDYAYLISERDSSTYEDLEFALSLAEKAIELEPNNFMIMDTLGWIHFQMGNLIEAMQYLEKSIINGGENSIILEHLGDVYFKMGKIKKAKDIFSKAVALNPNNKKLKEKLEPLND